MATKNMQSTHPLYCSVDIGNFQCKIDGESERERKWSCESRKNNVFTQLCLNRRHRHKARLFLSLPLNKVVYVFWASGQILKKKMLFIIQISGFSLIIYNILNVLSIYAIQHVFMFCLRKPREK